MKNKTHKNKRKVKKSHNRNVDIEKIKKLIVKDDVGCITVNNSFEENFKNYLKSTTKSSSKELRAKKNSASIAKELIRVFDKPLAPKSVNPKDDFYTYVNYEWLKKMKSKRTEKYYTRIDSFRMLQEKVYYQLVDIVKGYTS